MMNNHASDTCYEDGDHGPWDNFFTEVTIVPSKLRNDRFYEGHICVPRDHNSLQAACEKLQVSV
jgi:hypothetical protein